MRTLQYRNKPAKGANMGTTEALSIFCLDQSEAAFGSEDFPGSRWRYQAGIVEALAERLYFQHGAQADKAHLSAARSLRGAQHSLCMLSGTSAKLLCPPAPLTERAAVLARLHGLQPCCGASSNLAFALKLAALVAGSSRSASITAFVAGQCSISGSDLPGLVGVLGRHRVTIVSLASPAELGPHAVGALQRLTASLNDPSPGETNTELGGSEDSLQGIPKDGSRSGAGHKLVFLEPPEETLEPWQQLERALEALEHPDKQQASDTCAASHSAAAASADAAEPGGGDDGHTSSSAGAGQGEAAGLAVASRQRSSRSTRHHAGFAQACDVNHLWHRNKALLARRSGVYASAACRGESLDALGHLSSDGCMRPWLPSYANLPRAVGSSGPSPLHELYLQRLLPQPKWRVLMDIPGGIMRKASSRAFASSALSASLDDASCSPVGEQPTAVVKPAAEQHAASSNLHSTAAVPVAPRELQLEGTTVLSSETPRSEPGSASLTTAPGWESSRAAVSLAAAPSREQGRATRIGSGRSSGRSGGRPLKSCSGRRPLRLEADARSGRIMLVQSRDSRRLLRIIWCPTAGDASANASLPLRTMRQRQSIWEPSGMPEDGCAPKAKLLRLPQHELKFTLDPAAVSFSAIHNGQVLLVEQEALTADGRPSQSSNKGLFRHLSAEGGQVERCFFWLQGSTPATTLRDGTAANMCLPPSAAEAARQLRSLVHSSASKASSEVQSCAVLPLLHLSGSLQLSFQPQTASAEPSATGPGSKALTVQHQGCPAPSMGAPLSGSLQLTIGQPATSASEHERGQHANACMDLAAGHQKHPLASRAASCAARRPETVSMNSMDDCSLAGEVDLVVAAASGETGTEAGQDCFEDSALYELD